MPVFESDLEAGHSHTGCYVKRTATRPGIQKVAGDAIREDDWLCPALAYKLSVHAETKVYSPGVVAKS